MGSLKSKLSGQVAIGKAVAAKTTSDPADKAAMAEAGVSNNMRGAPVVTSVFYGDHKDIMLLSYFTALIKLFDGANGSGDPTVCLPVEQVLEWLGYALVVVIYVVRHFYEDPRAAKKPAHALDMPRKVTRCVVFMVFALCIHSQPVSCALPRAAPPANSTLSAYEVPSPHLQTLSYIQGGITLLLALVAAELLPTLLHKGEPATGKAGAAAAGNAGAPAAAGAKAAPTAATAAPAAAAGPPGTTV